MSSDATRFADCCLLRPLFGQRAQSLFDLIDSLAHHRSFGNYGTPDSSLVAGLYTQQLEELYARCHFEYEPVATAFPTFIMNHFANNSVYDAFNGTDYTPHNLVNYPEHSHWRKGLR